MTSAPDETNDDHPTARAMRLRSMNDDARRRRDQFDAASRATYVLMCECTDPACAAMIEVPGAAIDEARSDDHTFLLDPEHVQDAKVVDQGDGFVVVRLTPPTA